MENLEISVNFQIAISRPEDRRKESWRIWYIYIYICRLFS